MPFTPFHFGPGLLFKGGVPKHFSFTTFVVSQVVIDSEVLYYMFRDEYPLHRVVHTIPVAALAGTLAALTVLALRRAAPKLGQFLPTLRSESSIIGIWLGGLVGGISHVLLDSLIYSDVHPFWPWTGPNPFLGLVGLGFLLDACVIAGVVGLMMVGFWMVREWSADRKRIRG